MKSRKKKSNPVRAKRYKKTKNSVTYDNLEARQLLATLNIAETVNFSEGGVEIVHLESPVPVEQSADLLAAHLQLQQHESVVLSQTLTDQIGFEHLKYKQYFDGVPVEGSSYTLHVKDGQVLSMSGERIHVQSPVLGTAISKEAGLEAALDHIDADVYAWEDPVIAHANNLPSTPVGESVYLTNVDGDSVVAYKYDIYALSPGTRDYVYVNANSGEVVLVDTRIRGADVDASGASHYDGDVQFQADENGGTHTLVQVTDGVETLDNNMGAIGDFSGATSITSTSNVFDHPSGVSAHWGAELTLAYYRDYYNRDSYDDAGSVLLSYVNVSENLVNAFWNGSAMQYGEGNAAQGIGALTTLDIIGHEITHGVTEFSAGLIYNDESGALNESFSDIFGESVEWVGKNGNNDWLLGAEIGVTIRSFLNPNDFGQPDTYGGNLWVDGAGVHTNSGVQNKWFYLLSEGADNYANDFGELYTFDAIGIEAAGQIAYRNLSVYLTPNSTYQDARDGAVQSAIDLFGRGSQEHISTNLAWNAVGLYGPEIFLDQFDEIVPGSLIYQAQGSASVDGEARVLIAELEANQTLTVDIQSTSNLTPQVSIQYPDGMVLQYAVGLDRVANTVPVSEAGEYTILVDGTGTFGTFNYNVVLNADVENESFVGLDNGTMAGAELINSTSYDLGDSVDRLGVYGAFDRSEIPVLQEDGFESGALGSQWTSYSSSETLDGRIEVLDDFTAASGDFALYMHTLGVESNLNEAIWSLDLSAASNPFLSFAHAEWNDETTVLPSVFSNHRNGDGVSVSEDGVIWHTILTDVDTPAGEWNSFSINLEEFATDVGIELTSNFQIKFQQYDDGQLGSDGRGYDSIQIIGSEGSQDWYAFDLEAGQTATAAVGNGSFIGATMVELFDSSGNLLEAGTVDGNGSNSAKIHAATADRYFARVSGQGLVDYAMVVTRGTELDQGSSPTELQDVTGAEAILGSATAVTSVQAEPDFASSLAPIDGLFEGVSLSNGVTGGSVYSVLATFAPPTGTKVFGAGPTADAIWREGVHEFRADFAIEQFDVSLDIGSDDGATDVGFIRAYDSDGFLIDEVISSQLDPGEYQTLTVSSATGSIAYILAAGVGNDEVALDNLQYEVEQEAGDFYKISAEGGTTLRIAASFPGSDDLNFANQLTTPEGINFRMELTDIGTGEVLASGEDALSYKTDVTTDYRLKVFTTAGEGNYFLKVDKIDGTLFEVGDVGLGVAAVDLLTGEGYIMYSVQDVHDRFSTAPPITGNASHFVAVRHNGTNWQFDNNSEWMDFTPTDGDRLVASVNFGSDSIASLQGASGMVDGIIQGYDDSDLAFRVNRWAGVGNSGEFEVTGTYFVDSDRQHDLGATNLGVAAADDATGTGYMMYSVENVHTRFGGSPETGNSDHLIVVRYNGGWEFNDNYNWVSFTPAESDQLLASIDFDADTITSFQGQAAQVEGIGVGFILGDLTFESNRWDGTSNTGEFTVAGSFFTVSSQVYGEIGDVGDGVAVDDFATGTGFLLYSSQPVHARFAGNAPFAGSAAHIIAVRYDAGTSSWQYNDNQFWNSFSPLAGDRLIASIDFDADTITSLIGQDSSINGIGLGYSNGDLAFQANRWAGLGNGGEFEVTGTFFEV
jgi:Zn-dependent metalloprotease